VRDERRRKTGDGQRRGERAGSRCGKGAGPRRREIGGWILRRRRIRPISPRVPGLMGVCGRRPPLAGGERAETYMVRSPCEGRATECAGARAFAGPQQESKCTNSASLRQNTGLERHEKSRGKNHCHVVRGSLLKARWRWWGRPRVGGGRRWDPYRNAGSAGTRLGLHEVALLRRDCRSSRGGIARATSIRRRHFARRARTGTALETRNSARGVTWTT
jgi:hypothetical protein